jgi:hypothetical protein
MIKKRYPFGYDWIRYHEVDRMLLDGNIIQTEAQLAYYIYRKFGEGRYQILAWQKGHEGFWLFWLGDIYHNGFIRDKNKNKDLEKLKEKFEKANSYEDKEDIEDEMEFQREMFEIDKSTKRRGPYGIKTSRPGQLHEFQEF